MKTVFHYIALDDNKHVVDEMKIVLGEGIAKAMQEFAEKNKGLAVFSRFIRVDGLEE